MLLLPFIIFALAGGCYQHLIMFLICEVSTWNLKDKIYKWKGAKAQMCLLGRRVYQSQRESHLVSVTCSFHQKPCYSRVLFSALLVMRRQTTSVLLPASEKG